jgi:predicted DNA-binding transcriptional regulator AlpA
MPVNWTGDWSLVPATFDTEWMAAIQGVSRRTVWARCQKRSQHPRPMAWQAPYRWLKSSVQPVIEAGAPIRPRLLRRKVA